MTVVDTTKNASAARIATEYTSVFRSIPHSLTPGPILPNVKQGARHEPTPQL